MSTMKDEIVERVQGYDNNQKMLWSETVMIQLLLDLTIMELTDAERNAKRHEVVKSFVVIMTRIGLSKQEGEQALAYANKRLNFICS